MYICNTMENKKRRAGSLEVALVPGRYDPAAPGVNFECCLKRVPQHLINALRASLHKNTAGMMGIGKQQDNSGASHMTFFQKPRLMSCRSAV